MKGNEDDLYSPEETEQRLRKIMRGAAHRPTPLKAIPKRNGESRTAAKKSRQRALGAPGKAG